MKKTILLFGLFLIFSGSANAQTRTYAYFDQGPSWIDLYCGDVFYDHAEGMVDLHFLWHWVNGEMIWFKVQVTDATLVSTNGETFTLKGDDKVSFKLGWPPVHTFHYNVVGESGNRFIGSGTYNWETGETIFNKAICPGCR